MGAITPEMPALFTAQSSRPKASTAPRMSASTSAGFEMSQRMKRASPPCFWMAATVSAPPGTFTSETITRAPSRANTAAAARPIPEPAPVTSAALPSNLLLMCVSPDFPATRGSRRVHSR